MGGERKPPAPHTHLSANRDPTAVNTLPSRIPHATLITVHFTSSHITAIQLPSTLADAQLRELLVNATLSARSSPHDNQLLRRSQRFFSHSRVNPSGNATEEPQCVAAPKTKPIRLRIEHSLPQGLLQAHLALNERRVEELTQECQVARSASNRNLASARAFLNDSHAAKSLRQVRQTDHVHRPIDPRPPSTQTLMSCTSSLGESTLGSDSIRYLTISFSACAAATSRSEADAPGSSARRRK